MNQYLNLEGFNTLVDIIKSCLKKKSDVDHTHNASDIGALTDIQIGTVKTGASGSSASVSATTKGSVSILDFTIPKGDKGVKGDRGNDGTSVTITSTSITYVASSSGTIIPTTAWSSTIPIVSSGQYLWTKTVVNYSTGDSTTSYSVSKNGTDGNTADLVTHSRNGLMYSVDKIKLDGLPNITYGTDDLTAGTSSLTTGDIYLVYE
ncbi:MAG: hypothetical protein NC320_01660 [Clostridium sp.]|nr:hypothetical protein [Clostridium sp.]